MKKKTKRILASAMVFSIILAFTQATVFAQGNKGDINKRGEIVFVVGNDDFFPIEYYDKKTGKYEGVMPKILKDIEENTGIKFEYIRNGQSQYEAARNLQAEVVSAYITDAEEESVKESITVFSCVYSGKTIKIGWGFTEIADREVIDAMREYTQSIIEQEISGYLLSASEEEVKAPWYIGLINIFLICLIVAVIFAGFFAKKLLKDIKKNRMTDVETGIGNLHYFEHCFEKKIPDEERCLYNVAYIIIDGNYLQVYHGEHIFKDAVRYTAAILKSYDDRSCFAARISDNGFAFAFPAANQSETKQLMEEVFSKMNSYIDAYEKDERCYYKVAVCNLERNDKNSEFILYNLRKNCHEIKETDDPIVYCDRSVMNNDAKEKELLESILSGFSNDEFKIYLQFVVDNKTEKIVGCEALSRWDNPKWGLVAPGKYLSALEKSGHIARLDYYMFEMCCRQLHKWQGTELANLSLSCNITRTTLSEPNFIAKIDDISKRYVFAHEKLVIEITEETIEKSFDLATENVKKCKELGFRTALDDMGTGYTSLANLCDYPIDIVKIDREILLKIDTKNGKGLFNGIIALAHSLGMRVICEGVETQEQKNFVAESKCDMIQGWYYSHVFPVREGEEFAKEQFKH